MLAYYYSRIIAFFFFNQKTYVIHANIIITLNIFLDQQPKQY